MVEAAIEQTTGAGHLTRDVGGDATTDDVTEAIIKALTLHPGRRLARPPADVRRRPPAAVGRRPEVPSQRSQARVGALGTPLTPLFFRPLQRHSTTR